MNQNLCKLCNGTGEIVEGIYDNHGGETDQIIRKCPCKKDEDQFEDK